MRTEDSPSRRMNLLERLGVTRQSTTAESRAGRLTTNTNDITQSLGNTSLGGSANASSGERANASIDGDGLSPWQRSMRGMHRKGISENMTSSFRDDGTDETSKVDTWVGFYNPRKNGRRSLGP